MKRYADGLLNSSNRRGACRTLRSQSCRTRSTGTICDEAVCHAKKRRAADRRGFIKSGKRYNAGDAVFTKVPGRRNHYG